MEIKSKSTIENPGEISALRILLITKKFPVPARDGESIAVQNLSKALSRTGVELTLFSLNTKRHYYPFDADHIPEELEHFKEVYVVEVDNSISIPGALWSLIRGRAYHTTRYEHSRVRQKLHEVLQKRSFDIVQMETSILEPYARDIRRWSSARLILRAHNVEYRIWERQSQIDRNLLKRAYLKLAYRLLRKTEMNLLGDIDLLVCLSHLDGELFRKQGYHGPLTVNPAGIEVPKTIDMVFRMSRKPVAGFIGSLDWIPNVSGLTWFLDEVLPDVRKEIGDISMVIAGRHMPENLRKGREQKAIFLGEVVDSEVFWSQVDILVIPLFAGSGIRIKAIEAMSRGKLVISTGLGMEGIPAWTDIHYLEANTRRQFVAAFREIPEHPPKVDEILRNAFKLIKKEFDSEIVARKLIHRYRRLIESSA